MHGVPRRPPTADCRPPTADRRAMASRGRPSRHRSREPPHRRTAVLPPYCRRTVWGLARSWLGVGCRCALGRRRPAPQTMRSREHARSACVCRARPVPDRIRVWHACAHYAHAALPAPAEGSARAARVPQLIPAAPQDTPASATLTGGLTEVVSLSATLGWVGYIAR